MTNKEILEMMSAMKNKSCELGTVPMALVKHPAKMHRHSNTASPHLTHYGRILHRMEDSSGKTIIEKSGVELLHKNYRLVSNICFLSKLVKTCMLKQLMQHCERYNLLLDFQSAYRETIQHR